MSYRIELVGEITVFNEKDEPFRRALPAKFAVAVPLNEEFVKFLGLPKEEPETKPETEPQEPKEKAVEEKKSEELQTEPPGKQLTRNEFEQVAREKIKENDKPLGKGIVRKD